MNTETDNNSSIMDIEYVDILAKVAIMDLICWSNGSSIRMGADGVTGGGCGVSLVSPF